MVDFDDVFVMWHILMMCWLMWHARMVEMCYYADVVRLCDKL